MIHVVGSMTQECTGLEQASSLVNGHSAVVEQRVGVLLPPFTTHQLHQPDTSLALPWLHQATTATTMALSQDNSSRTIETRRQSLNHPPTTPTPLWQF